MNQSEIIKLVTVATNGYILLKSRKKERKRRFWVREIYMKRSEKGFFETTYQEIKSSDHETFERTFRMSVNSFNILLSLVHEKIEKISIRRPIEAECRLALTLMYLAYGVPRQILALQFRMAVATVAKITLETCEILWAVLSPIYIKEKRKEDWLQISQEFFAMWNMPNCTGAIDGKHINIICPPGAGSEYFNYKHRHSIVLMAVCDANYQFTVIDVGAPGSRSDGGVFAESSFGDRLLKNKLDFPPPKCLPNSSAKLPHYFVGDAAFPLRTNIMRPFPGKNLTEQHEYFNSRLSRARRTIENSFGIMACRWRILLHDIYCLPKNVNKIVCAVDILHNYLRKECIAYCPPNFADEVTGDSIIDGQWRNESNTQLQSAPLFGKSNNASAVAFATREQLCQYLGNNRI